MIKVLVVDDEALLALSLRRQLEHRGFEVVGVASSGDVAVDLCHTCHPDVVLMDIRMPIMDGIEATRRVMEECPTPVLVLSALPEAAAAALAQAAGAVGYLTKPSDIGAVAAAIEAAYRERHPPCPA